MNIKNCKIGKYGINVIGFGNLNVENTDIYYTSNYVNLRPDYGSMWNGTVNITNGRLHPSNDYGAIGVWFELEYDNNYLHNFGYDLALPNMNINGLMVDNSADTFYVFFNNEAKTGPVKGDLSKIKNYIKNNEFNFYYPKKENIITTNIKNKNNINVNVKNYIIDFGEN